MLISLIFFFFLNIQFISGDRVYVVLVFSIFVNFYERESFIILKTTFDLFFFLIFNLFQVVKFTW